MRVAAAALLGLLALLGVTMLFQDQLLFPTDAVPAAGPLPPNAEKVQVKARSGDELHGIHLRPTKVTPEPMTLVLGFGGNAWNAQHVAEYLHGVFPEAHVVAFHYRGYRPSTGRPSAAALLEDAPIELAEALDRVRPERVVVAGFSIGSGVAASLAGHPRIDGLILVTPFDSLGAVATDLYPMLPVGAFFRHDIDAATYLERVDTPVALIAAEEDRIIRSARTASLRPRVGNLRFDETIAGAGHNDIYELARFKRALRSAFDAVAAK